jgi:hypothetical protein
MVPNAAPAAADVRRSERLALPRLRTRQRAAEHDLPVQRLAEDGGYMLSRDDIIRMAREAGFFIPRNGIPENGALMRFAALVAAAEREACARVCESVIEEIREIADNVLSHEDWRSIQAAQDCAAAIRARGQQQEPEDENPSF